MRLSGDDGLSANSAGPSEATEMRQIKPAFVDPLITRPRVYYGDGPFDPPSSDDEDDLVVRGDSDSDAESVSLLDANKTGPSSPGRAERGEPSQRGGPDADKVRIYISLCLNVLFCRLKFDLFIFRNVLLFGCLQLS